MIPAYITWNVSPDIFTIGPFTIRWYGLLFALGFVVGYQILYWIFNQEGKKQKDLESLTIYMIVGVVVGARLGHCLFYSPGFYLSHPIEILKIWEGGLASHGAALGMIIALLLFHYKKPYFSLPWLADRLVIVIAFGAFCVRMGNLMNSEILGKPTTVPWAFIFQRIDMIPRHPGQLYEGLAYIIIFFILLLIYKKYKAELPPGRLAGYAITMIFIARFLIEFTKEEQASYPLGIPLNLGHLLSIPFIILGIIIIWLSYKYKDWKPAQKMNKINY